MISIILPCKNEPGIHAFVHAIERKFPNCEIIVSNDSEGKGKGWAIREALSYASGDLICFLDADREIPIRMLDRMVPFLADFPVVVGSKRIGKSPMRRKVMTRLTRLWFKLLFGLKADSQTGIKLFRREALEALNWNWESNGWIFDCEILARLQAKGFGIVEVPIECDLKRQLAFKTIIKIFGESLWLKWRLLCSSLS